MEGTVLRATDFGIFLDIGAVEDAFLHAVRIAKVPDTSVTRARRAGSGALAIASNGFFGVVFALRQNELGRDTAGEEPYYLYRKFKDSRKARRSFPSSPSRAPSSSKADDKGRCEALLRRSGDKLTGLRVLDIDAARGR